MESIRQERYPHPSKKTIKIPAKIIEKRKQIKKKTRHIVI